MSAPAADSAPSVDPVAALAVYAERTSASAVSPDGATRVSVDRYGRAVRVEGFARTFAEAVWLARLASEAREAMFAKRTRQLAEAARGLGEHEILGCASAPGPAATPDVVPLVLGVEIFPDAYRNWGFPDPVPPPEGERPLLVDCQSSPAELREVLLRQLAWASSPDRRIQVAVDACGAVAGVFVSPDVSDRYTAGLLAAVTRKLHMVACGYMRGMLRELTARSWTRAPHLLRSYTASWTQWPRPESALWEAAQVQRERPTSWPCFEMLGSVEAFSTTLVAEALCPGEPSAREVMGWCALPEGAELAVDASGLPRRVSPAGTPVDTRWYEAGLHAAREACFAKVAENWNGGPIVEVRPDPVIAPLLWTHSWWGRTGAEAAPPVDERAERFGLRVATKRCCAEGKDPAWVDRLYAKAAGVLVTERSPDSLLAVTVGADCAPTAVSAPPEAWAAHSPERVVELLNQCYLDAADQVRATQVWLLRELWRCPSDLVVDHYTPHLSFLHPVPGASAPVRPVQLLG
ncbi:hypothetical protein [Segniliparus rugosus]|uniref:Uncharacterized protein n=1 Tax=Segniliparus rugosus (strain ATCC BAA-974 / DSM 45345 / CCUG 50838 / CIP 108380 / JCM 13579 / CDC 945) TaxID=679197 RepID=E5XSZ2_SEGRC|nr:hypothetical protein [Segniliparus rugosus]EFV12534.1 hypothetical protein HMPREF9336_02614 [Segniliparus rugosus ATCC BAA-974]